MADRESQPANPTTRTVYPEVIPSINPDYNIVSFAHIKAQGKSEGLRNYTITFDPNGDDTIAMQYRQIRTRLQQSIANDATLKALDPKSQQTEYEQHLTTLVSHAMRDTAFDPYGYRTLSIETTNLQNLNALSSSSAFDCKHLSYIQGLLLHESDAYAVELGIRAQPTQFYIMAGATNLNQQTVLTKHQFIVTTAGNIIESTAPNNAYKITSVTLDELIAGYPTETRDAKLYAHSMTSVDIETAQKRLAALRHDPSNIRPLAELTMQASADILTSKQADNLAALKAKIEDACKKPIQVTSADGAAIETAHTTLQSEPHTENSCADYNLGENLKTVFMAALSIHNFSSAKLKVAPVATDEAAASKTPLPTSTQSTPAAPLLQR